MKTAMGQPPSELPVWALLRLGELGIHHSAVSHFLRDGDTIAASVAGDPVFVHKTEEER